MKKISMIIYGLLIYIQPLLLEKSFAEQVPEGFEELLETRVETVKLIVNDDRYINVKGEISNDFFRVTDDEERIYDFLNSQYVENENNRKIIDTLLSGVDSSVHCHGRRSSCQIGIEGINDVQYIVISDELKIRIMVPVKFLVRKASNNRYVKTDLEQNDAVIMHHQFDFSGSKKTLDASYQNEFFAGFSGGYFSGDFIIKPNSDEKFDSDKLAFDYLTDDLRFRVGYHNSYSESGWNSTNFLDTSEQNNVVSLDFGNTKELEYRSEKYSERIYFSVPTAGRLEVSRNDGRVLIRRNVSSGQNYISYSELPHGIYDIDISVKQGNNETYKKTFSVYNNKDNYSLEPGELDYFLSLGTYLEDNSFNKINDEEIFPQDTTYVKGKVSAQVNDAIKIGFETQTTNDDYLVKIGGEYIDENIRSRALFGFFNDNASIVQADVSFKNVSLNTEVYNSSKNESLSSYFYGIDDYARWSVNYSARLFGGNFYTSYTNNMSIGNSEGLDGFEYDEKERELSSFMLGYSFSSYLNSTIDMNATYTDSLINDDYHVDETAFNVSVNVPIGINAYSTTTYHGTSEKQGDYVRSALGNSYVVNDDLSMATEAGVTYKNKNFDYDLSGSAQFDDGRVNSSAYGYINNSDFSVVGDLSLSTITSKGRNYITSKTSDSYIVIHNDQSGADAIANDGRDFVSIAKVRKNEEEDSRVFLDKDLVVVPLNNYREYDVTIEEDGSDYHNIGTETRKGTSFPGSIVDIDINLKKVRTYISVFSDVEGKPIKNVSCRGEGCLSVEELSSGVFKFRVSEGVPFELLSNNKRCVIPNPGEFEEFNLGYNFCMPQFNLYDGLQMVKTESGKYLYYVGEFLDESIVDQYKDRFNENSITLIKKYVGDSIFIFAASTTDELANKVKQNIEELSMYAIEEINNEPYVSR